MALAIFDLDNTLLDGDSDYLWGQFLVEKGLVDKNYYEQENKRFYQDYMAGTLDISEFLAFALKPLAQHPIAALEQWRAEFLVNVISPILLPAAEKLIQKHRDQGDVLVIITATNRFVTQPIADLFNIENLLATEPEIIDGRYSGNVAGIPCFREGKVTRLQEWLKSRQRSLHDSWFYSDSHNDLPLLQQVTHPVAVDPDEKLATYAKRQQWSIISLRSA